MKKKETCLYVILLPHMDEEYNLDYVIKFGYTENIDDRMNKGYGSYYDFVSVLHIYKGDFTKKDEDVIKQYLKEYCLFKREWFRCCQEVLGFFNTYDTTEKLKEKIKTIPYKPIYCRKYYKVNFHYIEYIILKVYPNLTELLEIQEKRTEIFKELREYTEREQCVYIKFKYGITREELVEYTSKMIPPNPTIKSCEMMEEFNKIGDTTKRLKFLVDISEDDSLKKEDIVAFLELIPSKYKDYYYDVGPDTIKKCRCFESEVKKEWRRQKSNGKIEDIVVSRTYDLFKVGKKYSNKDIKDKLKALYQELEYDQKAKATDLELLFILKATKLQDSMGKWVNGLEILGKR